MIEEREGHHRHWPDEDHVASEPSEVMEPQDTAYDTDVENEVDETCLVWRKVPLNADHAWSLHPGLDEVFATQEAFLQHAHFFTGYLPTRSSTLADDCLEIEIGPQVALFLLGVPQLEQDQIFVYEAKSAGRTATGQIENNFDASTADNMRKHFALVEIATRKEVLSFFELGTFEVALKSGRVNICSARWAMRWQETGGIRSVKARLTISGFEDLAHEVGTFAATATRWAQRLVASTAVQQSWNLFTMDVASAFLRGMTFANMSTMSGAKPGEISVTPPAGADKYFRELPGMANYNSITHVHRLIKPAYGLRDAPKAWRTRLDIDLRALGGLPIPTDAALYVFRGNGRLCVLLSCHADDIKGAGTPKAFTALKDGLEKQFGKLTVKQGGG